VPLADFAKSFKNIWGVGVALAVAGPLGMSIPELYPPWPDGSRLIGVIFCAVAAILSFAWGAELDRRSRATRVLSIVATISLVCGLAFIIVYFVAYNSYVVVETQMVGSEQHKLRFVIGAETRGHSDAELNSASLEMLRDNQYDPERIWTRESLRRSRLLLFGSFLAAFSMLTFGMGLLATRSARSGSPAGRGVKAHSTEASG
jgi:hypothetical protein